MFELSETKIKKWSAEIGIADLSLSELDMRLVNALNAIYSDKFLARRLYLKGGASINKLYLQKTARLSVDLDFNAIGSKEEVVAERNNVRDKIIELLKDINITTKLIFYVLCASLGTLLAIAITT